MKTRVFRSLLGSLLGWRVAATILSGAAFSSMAAAAEQAPAVSVVVTLNNGIPASVVRGWPWTLRVTAFVIGGGNSPALAAGEPELAFVAKGQPAAWPWQRPTMAAKPVATDDVIAEKSVWFFLTPEQTTAITAGEYQLVVTWSGLRSRAEIVTVQAVANTASGATDLTKARLTSQLASLQGNTAAAVAALDGAIAAAPNSVGLLSDKAAILEAAGRTEEALVAADQALTLFKRTASRQTPPPILLLKMRERLFSAALDQVSNEPLASNRPTSPANATSPPAAGSPLATVTTPTPVTATVAPTTSAPATASASIPASASGSTSRSVAPPATTVTEGAHSPGTVVTLDLREAQIAATPNAQWASGAIASSRYGEDRYSEKQATGQPNVALAGNDPQSWCPATKGSGTQWLELSFSQPVRAIEVRIRQNNAPGAIVRVEAIDPEGGSHRWWSGKDPYTKPRVAEIAWFTVRVPATEYRVQKIRVTFDLSAVPDWVEVDAVQLVSASAP